VLTALALLLPAAARAAAPSWSGPVKVDAAPAAALKAVSCPSATLCVAVDSLGQEIAFATPDPATPAATADAIATTALVGVSCPTATQCTAINATGEAITFDPASPSGATSVATGETWSTDRTR
jgi:hypothetical protein